MRKYVSWAIIAMMLLGAVKGMAQTAEELDPIYMEIQNNKADTSIENAREEKREITRIHGEVKKLIKELGDLGNIGEESHDESEEVGGPLQRNQVGQMEVMADAAMDVAKKSNVNRGETSELLNAYHDAKEVEALVIEVRKSMGL